MEKSSFLRKEIGRIKSLQFLENLAPEFKRLSVEDEEDYRIN